MGNEYGGREVLPADCVEVLEFEREKPVCPGPTSAIVDLGDLALEDNIYVSVD